MKYIAPDGNATIEGVVESTAAPWFEQEGGGTQYVLPSPIKTLIKNKSLEKL